MRVWRAAASSSTDRLNCGIQRLLVAVDIIAAVVPKLLPPALAMLKMCFSVVVGIAACWCKSSINLPAGFLSYMNLEHKQSDAEHKQEQKKNELPIFIYVQKTSKMCRRAILPAHPRGKMCERATRYLP